MRESTYNMAREVEKTQHSGSMKVLKLLNLPEESLISVFFL